MFKPIHSTCFFLLISFPALVLAEGFCIKYTDGKLSTKTTTSNSCPKKQAFIPKVAGAQGETGATGPQGAAGANGSARAYGFVSSAGNINTALSSANVSARKVATGVYCISAGDISPSTVMPIVSVDQDEGTGNFHIVQVKSLYSGVFGCSAFEWGVVTSNFSAGSFASSDCAFSFLIP